MLNSGSANEVLIRFIENWRQSLDNHKCVGITKPILYQFTKPFCATLNERDFSFNKCCAKINVREFPNKVARSSVRLTRLFLRATFSALKGIAPICHKSAPFCYKKEIWNFSTPPNHLCYVTR